MTAKRTVSAITMALAMAAAPTSAFAPLHVPSSRLTVVRDASTLSMSEDNLPYFLSGQGEERAAPAAPKQPKKANNSKGKAPAHAEGVFSPIVLLAKNALGDDELNKIRAKAIALHSDVIGSFVDTAESSAGKKVLEVLFQLSDKNGDGSIDQKELAEALHSLGFDWLKEKQLTGIFARADTDESGAIDMQEWLSAAPKTLRTNLIKLAKKNGGEMGLLV